MANSNSIVALFMMYLAGVILYDAVLAVTAHNAAPYSDPSKFCSCDEDVINRRGFPPKFIFGSASAAYQVEGAYNENGKGPSLWDNFTHTYPEKIVDHSNADVTVDSYHRYKEDVQLLKNMGLDAYKFSISWSRILPGGSVSNGVNQDGIDYYNDLINELLANGIQPWITIFHLDYPQSFEDEYGGFLSSRIVDDFTDLADILFSNFGDRVKHWITINEPFCLSYFGYTRGIFAPARCSPSMGDQCVALGDSATEPYNVMHNQLLAHAAAVKLYRNKYQGKQKGKIGITINTFWFVPYNDSSEHVEATARAFDFMLGWAMNPLTFGGYPESMINRVGARLPKFSKEEEEMIKGSFDFLGLNYYSAKYAVNFPEADPLSYVTDSGYIYTGNKDGVPIGEQGSSTSHYNNYPKGIRKCLQLIKEKYNDPPIYITENGMEEDNDESLSISEAIKDYKRKNYFQQHLCCLREAIEEDGVNVKGYFAWSLTDNWEWKSGFIGRFGINYVDFKDKSLRRYPKFSAQWFKSILADGRIENKPQATRVSEQ